MELIIVRDAREVGRLRLSEGTFSIGRGLHNTVALDDPSVSRRHARIRVDDGKVFVQDLASANGSFLRGERLKESEAEDGDVLQIGPFFIEIRTVDDEFVEHDKLDSTLSRVDLEALQKPAPAPQPQTQALSLPPPEPRDGQEFMDSQDLFGLSDEGWLERVLEGPGANTAQTTQETRLPVLPPETAPAPVTPPMGTEPARELTPSPAPDESEDPDLDGLEPDNRDTPRLPNTPNLADALARAKAAGQATHHSLDDATPRLVVREGQGVQPQFELGRGTSFIGRAEEMDVVLLDPNSSRRHAAISYDREGYTLRDLWSLNGVRLNGERISAARLRHGDRVQVGDTILEFVWPLDPTPASREILPAARGATTAPTMEVSVRQVKAVPPPARRGMLGLAAALILLAVLAGVFWPRGTAPTTAGPSAIPLDEPLKKHLADAEAALAQRDFSKALGAAQAVQAAAPASPEALRTVQRIFEQEMMARLEAALAGQVAPRATETATAAPVSAAAEPDESLEAPKASPTPRPSVLTAQAPRVPAESKPAADPLKRNAPPPAQVSSPPLVRGKAPPTEAAPDKPKGSGSAQDSSRAPVASAKTDLDRRVLTYYQKGQNYVKQERHLDAVKAFEKALAEDPYKESELYYQIEDEILAVRARLHEQARPLVSEAQSLIDEDRLLEARQKLTEAIARDPYYVPAVNRLRQVEAEINRKAARLLVSAQGKEEAGAPDEARQLYKQVLSLIPEPSSPYHQKAVQRLDQLK